MRFLYTLLMCLLVQFNALMANTIVVTDDDLQDDEYFWTSDNEYVLDGMVVLDPGGILNIEAGTVIRGKSTSSDGTLGAILVIARGAQIFAEGTESDPIVFTAEMDDLDDSDDYTFTDKGLWGGLHILGAAPITYTTPTIISEQLSAYADQSLIEFGGTQENDNSGTLTHVSIRHAGSAAGVLFEEYNGLTLSGVGSGTTIDYIEIYASGDDGIAIEGGTVNLKHLSVTFSGDDSFDWNYGWRGKGQFWLGVQGPDGDRCGEHDGGVFDGTGDISRPIISNVTLIGPGMDIDTSNAAPEALLFRDRTGGVYANSIFTNFPNAAIQVEDLVGQADAYDNLQDGSLLLNCNYWWGFGSGDTWSELVRTLPMFEDQSATLLIQSLEDFDNQIADPQLTDLSADPDLFDPRPVPNSPALTAACALSDSFFEPVNYVGAFGSDIWLAQWSGMAANLFFESTLTNTLNVTDQPLSLEVYPNPTTDFITVELEQEAVFRLLDVNGKLISKRSYPAGKIEMDLSDLAPAVYFLQAQTKDQIHTQKVVLK